MSGETAGVVMVSADAIEERVRQLGERISRDYRGQELLLVAVLKGAFMFLADLARQITVPVSFDFMAVSSYGKSTLSSGVVRILKDLEESIEGRHVVLVEDIVDTGLTLSYLYRLLDERRPATLRVCVLLDKPDRRKVDVPIHYRGFEIPDVYVVGYGLDMDGRYRNLPYVLALPQEGEKGVLS